MRSRAGRTPILPEIRLVRNSLISKIIMTHLNKVLSEKNVISINGFVDSNHLIHGALRSDGTEAKNAFQSCIDDVAVGFDHFAVLLEVLFWSLSKDARQSALDERAGTDDFLRECDNALQ